MDRLARLVGLGLALGVSSASAYVTPSPPPGFSPGTSGGWTMTPPSPASQLGSIMRGPGPSIAGAGQTSAAYRLAPSAARVLAGRVIAGAIPGVGLALGVAWLASQCFEKQGAQWVRTCGQANPPPQSTGLEYVVSGTSAYYADKVAGCLAAGPALKTAYGFSTVNVLGVFPGDQSQTHGVCRFSWMTASGNTGTWNNQIGARPQTYCPLGWYITTAGCVQNQPVQVVTPQQVEDEVATKPLPATLPAGVPYPIELPTIFNPTDLPSPTAQPLRVPTGNPVPVPNSNPQTWSQPHTRYTQSPTTAEPWRMDVTPEDVPVDTPQGNTGPTPVTPSSPNGEPAEKELDLCEKNPDIVACQKLGTLEPVTVPNKDINLAINKDNGWGASSGSCPADKTFVVLGKTMSFKWTLICNFASGIRPVIIGLAWLSAALVFFGFSRKD